MVKFILVFVFIFSFQNASHSIEVEFEQSRDVPLVFLSIAIKTGSTSDPKGKDGLTYLLGELLLRGTQNKSKSQIDTLLDQMGSSLAVDIRSEALELSGSVLSSEMDNYLLLVQEILSSPAFNEGELEKLKKETLSQIAHSKSNDSSLLRYYWPKIFFGDHPYGNIKNGLEKSIKTITTADLTSHYKKIFQSNNLIIVGTGNTEPRTIIDWGKKIQLNPNTKNSIPTYEAPLPQNQKRVILIDKPNRTQAQIMLSHKGSAIQSSDYYPLSIINHGFGGSSFQAKLMQELRVKSGWSYGAYSYFNFARFPYAWNISYAPATQFLKESLLKTLSLFTELSQNGISEDEFNFAKNSLIQSAGFRYDTPTKRVSNLMTEKLLGLPKGFYENFAKNIKDLSHSSVNETAKKFFHSNEYTLVIVATASEVLEDISHATGVPVNQIAIYPYERIEDYISLK